MPTTTRTATRMTLGYGDQLPATATAAVSERALRPLTPQPVMPTPASTASTAILYSLSGSESDSDELDAFLSKQQRKKISKSKAERKRASKTRDAAHSLSLASSASTSSSSSTSPVVSSQSERKQQHKHRSSRQQQQQYQHVHSDDLEYGERHDTNGAVSDKVSAASHQWQVLREFAGETGILQVVHLKRANFGLKWRSADPTPTCMVGPHWWLMATTFTVFTGVALVITVLTAPKSGFGEAITGILLSTACLSMYAMVGCANPGIVERIDVAPDDTYSYCDQCDSYRPQGALHCMDCRVCIEGYDHHCPWTGKCVGKGNVRYFYAWLFFLVLAFVYEVIEFTTYVMPPEDQPSPTYYDDLTFAPLHSGP